MSERNERRVAVLWIGEEDMLQAFEIIMTGRDKYNHVLRLRDVPCPRDCKVLRVCQSFGRRAFGFLLEHESFDVVPDGQMAPNLDYETQWEYVPRVSPDEYVTPTTVVENKE